MNYKKIFQLLIKEEGKGVLRKGSVGDYDFIQITTAFGVFMPAKTNIFKDDFFRVENRIDEHTIRHIMPESGLTEPYDPLYAPWSITDTIAVIDKHQYRQLTPPDGRYPQYMICEPWLKLFEPTVHIKTYARHDKPGLLFFYEDGVLAAILGALVRKK